MKKLLKTAILGACLLQSSCLGPNNAFERVHYWNQHAVESKWGQEAIFLGCVILPVYSLAYLGDIVIFNSIEFWGGDNPIAPPPTEDKK